MTPEEKAQELVLKYLRIDNNTKEWFNVYIAKQCALISVDEIIKIVPYSTYKETLCPYDGAELSTKYWEEVKEELENYEDSH